MPSLSDKINEQVEIIEAAKKKIKDMIAQENGGKCKVQVNKTGCFAEDFMIGDYVYFTDIFEDFESKMTGTTFYEYELKE